MTGRPIGQVHPEEIPWLAQPSVAGLARRPAQSSVVELGRWRGQPPVLELGRWPEQEQIRSNAWERMRGALPDRDEDSRAIEKGFAKIPGHKRYENTTESSSCSTSSSERTVSNEPRCSYRSSTSAQLKAACGAVVRTSSYTVPARRIPMGGLWVDVGGWVAIIKRTRGPEGQRAISG